jgi:hypothetical protein
MAREEGEKLADVAGIGLGRIAGELALDGEINEPSLDRALEVGRGDKYPGFAVLSQAAPRACANYFESRELLYGADTFASLNPRA